MSVGFLQRESLLAEAFVRSPLAKVVITLETGALGVVVEANAAFGRLVGRERHEVIGTSWATLCADESPLPGADEDLIVCTLLRADGTPVPVSCGLVTVKDDAGTAYAFAEVTESRDADREAEQLRITIGVQREITAVARDRDAVLRLIADRTLQVVPSGDTCVVQELDADAGVLRSVAGSGRLGDVDLPPRPMDASLSGIAITTGRTVRCDDTETDPRADPGLGRAMDIRSVVLTPLFDVDGAPLGVLLVASRQTSAFDDSDERLLTLLGHAVSGALHHAAVAADNFALLDQTQAAVRALATEQEATLAAVEQLVQSERRFASVFEHGPIAKIVVGLRGEDRGRIMHANPAFHDIFGRPTTGPGRMRMADLVIDERAGVLEERLADLAEGRDRGGQSEVELRRADGRPVTVSAHTSVIDDEGRPQVAVIQFLDVTAAREAQAALTRSEEQFRTAFDGSPIGMFIADEHGRIRQASPAAVALTGRTADEMVELSAAEPIPEESWPPAGVAVERNIERPDGTGVWTRSTVSLIPGPDQSSWRLIQVQDISAERAAADLAHRRLERLRATLDLQRAVTAVAADRDATVRVIADRALEVFEAADAAGVVLVEGAQLRCVAASGSLAAVTGGVIPATGSFTALALANGGTAACPDTSTDDRVDGEACARLGIHAAITAALHADNRVIGSLTVTSNRAHGFDDTDEQHLALLADSLSAALRHADDAARNAALLAERTEALAALQLSETRFRLTFDNSPLGVALVSLDPDSRGRYLAVNPAMSEITGYRADELTAMTYRDLFADEVGENPDVPARVECRYRHRDGHDVWVALSSAVVRDDAGRDLYVVNQVEDISRRREAEIELRRQARLLELIPAAVIVRDLDGIIRWWNAGATELYGWPASEAAGQSTHRLLDTVFPTGTGVDELRQRLLTDGHWSGQLEHRTAAGGTVTVASQWVLHQPDGRSDAQVLEINADVTAARAAERALAESEQRFRAQFTNAAIGQVICEIDGTMLAVNPAYSRLVGRPAADLIGHTDRGMVHPDDTVGRADRIAELLTGQADFYTVEGRLQHATGRWIDVEATISLVRDPGGKPEYIIAVITDISDRRTAERAHDRAAEELAERNDELEAAEQLRFDIVGMLGHEIGNPLSSIRGYAEVLVDDWEILGDERRVRAIDAISRQADRLDQIVRAVLAMVTIDTGDLNPDRHELSLHDEIRRAFAATGDDRLTVAGADAQVLANSGHLQQILVNLLTNAAKYAGGVTAVRVTADGGQIEVHIVDDGPGVPEEFRGRLFERLTRAARDATAVRGTGLGLYIVRGLAQANHGDIRYEPGPAGGSIFVLSLEAAGSARGLGL